MIQYRKKKKGCFGVADLLCQGRSFCWNSAFQMSC